jgi:hypothetical protein
MGKSAMQCVDRSLHNVGWRIEVRLSDFKVNNVPALCFQGTRLGQNFKRSFRAQSRHTPC